ncbi:hypothetical protein STW0522RAO56_27390 [Raoultella planticola]|nr:hypothetical protein STW0522RAO56_27390 [Raoultella planticola]
MPFRQARASVVPGRPTQVLFLVGPCKRSAAGQIDDVRRLPVIRAPCGALSVVIKGFSDCAGFVGWRLAPDPTYKSVVSCRPVQTPFR